MGARWTLVRQYASIIEYVVLAAVAAAILLFLWRRWKAYTRPRRW